MKKQCVVRTAPEGPGNWYEPIKMEYLQEKLEEGWTVVMVNPIGKNLEYILEKEIVYDKK